MKLERYLETDTKADFRSEYCYGEVFAIPAASANRARLTVQLAAMLHSHVRGSACEVFGPNLRIMASPNRVYTYSDLSVVCGGPLCSDGSLTNPTLIVEILSPSTEAYDRGKKAEMYRKIPSLQELLLIAQDRPHVELQRRQADGSWNLTEADGLDASIELAAIAYRLRLAELYETVLANDTSGRFSRG